LSNRANEAGSPHDIKTVFRRLKGAPAASKKLQRTLPDRSSSGAKWRYRMSASLEENPHDRYCTGEATLKREPAKGADRCFSWRMPLPLCVGNLNADWLRTGEGGPFTQTVCGKGDTWALEEGAAGMSACLVKITPPGVNDESLPGSLSVDCEWREFPRRDVGAGYDYFDKE
jgi:hypothetical protein